jgi:UDP-glucose 4-epimerase
MSTILVTGSAGRVGSRVARQLLEAGHRVTGFDLRASGIDHPAFREVLGGFDDRAAARQAVQGAEAILHLGAFMSWLPADRDRLFSANVEGTRVLLEEAVAAKPKRLVFASSGEVYPENVPDYQPIDEDHPLKPRSPYGLSKLLGEEIVHFFERTSGTSATILRFSHTQDASELLDPGSFFSGPRFFLQPKIRQQQGFGNEAGRPFRMHITDTRDMVAGIMLALTDERAAGRTYNLGATEPVDFAAALPMMAQLTGLPLKTIDLPGAGVFYETSNARIRTELGYEPQWTFERMIGEAAQARVKRAS